MIHPPNYQLISTFKFEHDGSHQGRKISQSVTQLSYPRHNNASSTKAVSCREQVSAYRSTLPICWNTGVTDHSLFSDIPEACSWDRPTKSHLVADLNSEYFNLRQVGSIEPLTGCMEAQSAYQREFPPKKTEDRFNIKHSQNETTIKPSLSPFDANSVYKTDFQCISSEPGNKRLPSIFRVCKSAVPAKTVEQEQPPVTATECNHPKLESATTYKEAFKGISLEKGDTILRTRCSMYPERLIKNVEIGNENFVNPLVEGSSSTSYNTTYSSPKQAVDIKAAGITSPGYAGRGGGWNPNLISTGCISYTPFTVKESSFCRRRRLQSVREDASGLASTPLFASSTVRARMQSANVWPFLHHRSGCFYTISNTVPT